MRKRFSEDTQIEENSLNLTPLIDVVFVVLVTFILIAPMLEIDLVDISTGKGDQKTAFQETSKIQIVVKEDNSIFINNQKVEIQNLPNVLKFQKIKYPHHTLQLFHDRSAQFGTYQTIKNLAETIGFEEMQVVLKPE